MKSFPLRLPAFLAASLFSLGFLNPFFTNPFFDGPERQVTTNIYQANLNKTSFAFMKVEPVNYLYDHQSGSNFHALKTQRWAGSGGTEIHLLGASLRLPAGATVSPLLLSITALRQVDMPVPDEGMVNVTAGSEAYRFLPHGTHFAKPVALSLSYDEAKIPVGYSAKDIVTFFFDEEGKHWTALPKDSVDELNKIVASTTTHFTDMMNAVIKVPESPKTEAFTPNAMSGIQNPDPTSEIVTIAAPSANQMGSANLDYPIKLPAGRNGMQPRLTIQYNSEGSNGWMGLDWDLSTPFVSIETRWGVPRYNEIMETETYTIDGAQLSPVAHRSAAITRTTEKQFYPRVNNDFQKIIRHGNHPTNYWWEVTEKSGVRHFFGGTPAGGVDPDAVLTDKIGNIAQWALTEDRDPSNNFVKYRYNKVSDAGVVNGNAGINLYLASITYTGSGNTEGKYSVVFTRDRDLGQPKRKDITINGRLGFKQVTSDLLKKIAVKFDGLDVRSYELNYREGAFYKTLLQDIKEFDAAGTVFTTHTFDYYNDVQVGGSYQPLKAPEEWKPQNDVVKGTFLNPIPFFNDNASALGGNKSIGGGFGIAVTIGPDDNDLSSKTNTAGVVFGFNYSVNEGMLAMVDINGDGLVDKVYKKDGQLFFRANKSGPNGNVTFGPKQDILGLNDFNKGEAFAVNVGLESNFVIYAGFGYTYTENINSVYFSDVNGDQLPDIVNNGTVYFNHIDSNGNPVFTTSSADTPSPIKSSSGIDLTLVTNDPTELEKAIDDNPLHDVVRVWVAPFAGTINITQPVKLVPNNTSGGAPSGTTDGVRVSIQHKGTELWSARIVPNDFTPKSPTGVSSVAVQKGDRLYFRVQSVFNGANDKVFWTPQITYSSHLTGLNDANALPVFQFQSDKDFLMSAPLSTAASIGGTIHIQGDFKKSITSDSITVKVLKKSLGVFTTLLQEGYRGDQVTTIPVSLDENVQKGDELYFIVSSQTNIDWTSLTWNPYVYYTASTDPKIPQVIGSNGKPLIFFSPTVDFQAYTKTIQASLPWTVPVNSTLTIEPKPVLNSNAQNGDITFTVKKENELLQKETIKVTNGVLGAITALKVTVNQGEKIFFEYHTLNSKIADAFSSADVDVTANPGGKQTVIAGQHTVDESFIFGPMYRHWGQFAYNGNRARADQPIIETDLELAQSIKNPPNPIMDLSTAKDADEMQAMYAAGGGNQPKENKFIYLVPNNSTQSWIGYDNLTYVNKDSISSSRMGKDDLSPINPVTTPNPGSASGAVGIKKVTKTDEISFGVAVGPDQNLGGSISGGFTKLVYDFSDMNGDGYPDILSNNKIQYTHPYGGLEATANSSFGFGNVSQSNHFSAGFSAGGKLPNSRSSNASSSSGGAKAAQGQSKASASAGISAKFNVNTENEKFAFMDINGDGLPDRVHEDGNVELNVGYSFLKPEKWGYSSINAGTGIDYGGGVSINISNYSIVAGVSLSRGENETTRTLQDMNGDGLPDYIASVSPLVVHINTGNGFGPAISWTGANAIRQGVSTGEGVNVAFTIGIHIIPILPVVKLCINPQINIGQGADRTRVQFNDINGDGYPDFLQSEIDSTLTVSLSNIQRTNKLRKVVRPLGGSFTLDYTRIGNTYDMPNTVWALATVDLFDGVPGDGPDRTNNTFQYQNGHYDRNQREFYGFGKVITLNNNTDNQDIVYRTTEDEFINDNFYEKGLLKSEVTKDAKGNKFTEIKNTYELKNIQTGATLPAAIRQSDVGAAFPALVLAEKLFYEGQPAAGKTTSTSFAYDAFGNMADSIDFGDAGAADDLSTAISYHSVPSKYIMNVPGSLTISGSGKVYRQSATTIDNNTGNVTELREYLASGDIAKSNMTYDGNGNLTSITRPENTTGQRLTYTYEYDQQVQTYRTKTSDSYGYSSGMTYDVRFGKVLSATDMNGQQTQFTIDNAGRISTIREPFEIASNQPFTISFEYHPNDRVPWAMGKHFDPQHPANFIETAAFHDGLGRRIQTKKDVAIFVGPQATDQEVMSVSGSTLFDAFGRPLKQWYPLTEPKGTIGVYNTGADVILPELMTYDVLDRTLTRTLQDQSVETASYGFGNDRDGVKQFLQKSADTKGIETESFLNVRQLVKATKQEYSQGQDIWTSYNYNPVNELINVTDDQNKLITMEHDQLGRKVSETQPDAGTTNYKYDLVGNLSEKTTANLQSGGKGIKYTYDHERLSKITYPLNPQNNVTMTYGAAGATFFRTGRLVTQQDGSGTQEFFYNQLGAIVKNVRVIKIPNIPQLTYTTQWKYDTWNRLTNMTYPDGETLTYDYNLGGGLQKMTGIKGGTTYNYLKQLGYDKFERRIYMSYGNGTDMNYTFEPDRRRLNRLRAKTSAGRLMMDNTYTYDSENNILNLVNNAPVPPSNLMGGKSNYQYTYDDLYRVTDASGSFTGSTHTNRFTLAMRYNSVSAILSKKQLHEVSGNNGKSWTTRNQTTYDYNYDYNTGIKPDAPIHIGSAGFTYDANGNQAGWQDDVSAQNRQIVWDEENRIQSLSDNGELFRYTYDASGTRVLKSSGNAQTVSINGKQVDKTGGTGNYTIYVNPYEVVRSGGYTKHYYVEGQRIVSKLGVSGNGGSTGTSGGNKTDGLQLYYHTDHLGDAAFITDALGEVYQHLEYFPFGETFIDEHGNQERTPYLYTGKELDEETGLYYYGARYYDPRTSLWVSVDPSWNTPRQIARSPYAYVGNNPIVYVDPDGHQEQVGPINITQWSLTSHVLPRHTESGVAEYEGKSKFYATTKQDITAVIKLADNAKGVQQEEGGLFKRKVNVGNNIGKYKSQGGGGAGVPTSTLIVITDNKGKLITAYPGPPKKTYNKNNNKNNNNRYRR